MYKKLVQETCTSF